MKRISGCETVGSAKGYDQKNHWEKDGETVRRGRVTPDDIGLYQISFKHWGQQAMQMELNLFELEYNEKFALWLYHNRGTEDWYPSKHCWSN
jgi:hypothetical protein